MKMDSRVTVEAAVSVYDVETVDEAVSIAIAKTGKMLNPDLNYVDIGKSSVDQVEDDADVEPGFVAAGEGLVGLELEMSVFGVEDEQHAARVVQKEIGQQLTDIPLEILSVEPLEDENEEEESAEEDDELPEFDELVEE